MLQGWLALNVGDFYVQRTAVSKGKIKALLFDDAAAKDKAAKAAEQADEEACYCGPEVEV
jgi:aminoglycoside phosphotransferase family enzyme